MIPKVPLLALLALLVGCGGERSFDAPEFVDAANEAGAGILLGPPLESSQEDLEVFDLEVAPESATGAAAEHSEDEHGHGGGSIAVATDADGAAAEFQRCETAVTLTCYRAANVALILEGIGPDEQARIDRAIRELASD